MKALNRYITEKFQVSKDYKYQYTYTPKDKKELIECIKEKIEKEGLGTKDEPLDLNNIDVSNIIDMSYLFDADYETLHGLSLTLNGYFDISDWDVSNVENMRNMFYKSNFNGDISDWNVRKVKDMHWMFRLSKFDGDISGWDVSNVENMEAMFMFSQFTGKKGDITKWNTKNVKYMQSMFDDCPLEDNPPKWYKE